MEEQLAEGVWIGATTDLWISTGGGGEPFMSFTVRYLSSDWQLKSRCLETLYFPEDHTAEHITEMLENMLQDWKIKKESLSGVTTDHANNMKKAFEKFGFLVLVTISIWQFPKFSRCQQWNLLPEHANI